MEGGNWFFLINRKLIYAHDCSLPTVHLLLVFVGGVLDFLLHIAALEGANHPAERVNFFKIRRRPSLDFIGKSLHKIRSGKRIDCLRRSGFICDDLLRAQRDACRLLGRQRKRLIIRICMQRLRTAENRCHSLNRRTHNVVFRLLRCKRGAGGLGVEAQHPRARVLRLELLSHNSRPHAPRSPEFGDFFQKIIMSVEKEGNPGSEVVDIEPCLDRSLHVSNAVA